MATKPKTQAAKKSAASKPAATKPATAKGSAKPAAPASAAGDLSFDTGTVVTEGNPGQRPDSRAAQEFADRETIHASQCVVNSECTLTSGCRGRLRQTSAISGKVQIYCPKCGQFAAGTRPLHGLVSGGGGKLFDRVGGK